MLYDIFIYDIKLYEWHFFSNFTAKNDFLDNNFCIAFWQKYQKIQAKEKNYWILWLRKKRKTKFCLTALADIDTNSLKFS